MCSCIIIYPIFIIIYSCLSFIICSLAWIFHGTFGLSFLANTSALNQRWNNVNSQRSSTLFQRWYLVGNESWADVDSTLIKQHWKNYVHSVSVTKCCFNVDIWFQMKVENVCSSALLRRLENSIETTLSIAPLMFTRKWLKNKRKLSFQVLGRVIGQICLLTTNFHFTFIIMINKLGS